MYTLPLIYLRTEKLHDSGNSFVSHDHVLQRHHVHRTRKQKLFLIYAIIAFYVYFTQISLSYLGLWQGWLYLCILKYVLMKYFMKCVSSCITDT